MGDLLTMDKKPFTSWDDHQIFLECKHPYVGKIPPYIVDLLRVDIERCQKFLRPKTLNTTSTSIFTPSSLHLLFDGFGGGGCDRWDGSS